MHSSGMHTTCLLPIFPWSGGVPGPRGCTWSWREGCTWSGGCTWSRGCTSSGGCTWSREVYLVPGQWGVPGLGVYLVPGGVPGPVGVYLPRYSPLWTEWQTGAKILPCPKLHLWAVEIKLPPVGPVGLELTTLTITGLQVWCLSNCAEQVCVKHEIFKLNLFHASLHVLDLDHF